MVRKNSILSSVLSLPILGVSGYALSVTYGEIGMAAGISGLVLGLGLLMLGLAGLRKGR